MGVVRVIIEFVGPDDDGDDDGIEDEHSIESVVR